MWHVMLITSAVDMECPVYTTHSYVMDMWTAREVTMSYPLHVSITHTPPPPPWHPPHPLDLWVVSIKVFFVNVKLGVDEVWKLRNGAVRQEEGEVEWKEDMNGWADCWNTRTMGWRLGGGGVKGGIILIEIMESVCMTMVWMSERCSDVFKQINN